MAPAKSSRAVADDHKADAAANPKEKGNEGKPTSAKMRRGASQSSASQLREAAAVAPTSAPSRNITEPQAPSINWSLFERESLHSYCREHQLSAPTAFASKFHHTVLSRPGSIGQYSPTMIRKQQARRQSKDGLEKAVRKHFNGLGIQENDVIVDFIYKVRSQKMFGGADQIGSKGRFPITRHPGAAL
ncbi:hypothetical protein C2857_007403 [Epichloe festucae Fl1]|uniref:Histone deacetylase complex subunit SAP30 Sin3 binding domain-containing protein n=1 Tax=Epichloe festucae (strain Fl1) TaxID=877507 RepID=A0A7S9PSV0_EPIFF|nr:hypothetical protein C2857_007403 [Epichloe festucae Fl1]